MQTRHRLTQAIFFRKQNLIIIVIINIIVIIIMPSSFVHADRLKFWEITMEITEMGFLKFATIYGHIGSSGMTHINKAQKTPTNFNS